MLITTQSAISGLGNARSVMRGFCLPSLTKKEFLACSGSQHYALAMGFLNTPPKNSFAHERVFRVTFLKQVKFIKHAKKQRKKSNA